MELILFYLGLGAVFIFLKNIVGITFTEKKYRYYIFLVISVAWGIYIIFKTVIFPDTFAILVLTMLISKEPPYIPFCWTWIYTLIDSMICYTIYIIGAVIGGNVKGDIWKNSVEAVVLIILSVISILMRNRVDKNIIKSLKKRDYLVIFITIAVSFVLSGVSYVFITQNILSAGVGTIGKALIIFSLYFIIVISSLFLLQNFKLKHYNSVLNQRDELGRKLLELEKNNYEMMQKKNEDLRAFRHDYNAHIIAIRKLAEKNDYEEVDRYIKRLGQIKESTEYFFTNNAAADAVINSLYEEVPSGISFNADGRFPDKFEVDDMDICTIVSNLMKNAIEGVLNTCDADKRFIYFSVFSDESAVNLHMENASPEYGKDISADIVTSKTDVINHGWGLKNVKKTLDKYGGILNIKCKDGVFLADAYIPYRIID